MHAQNSLTHVAHDSAPVMSCVNQEWGTSQWCRAQERQSEYLKYVTTLWEIQAKYLQTNQKPIRPYMEMKDLVSADQKPSQWKGANQWCSGTHKTSCAIKTKNFHLRSLSSVVPKTISKEFLVQRLYLFPVNRDNRFLWANPTQRTFQAPNVICNVNSTPTYIIQFFFCQWLIAVWQILSLAFAVRFR